MRTAGKYDNQLNKLSVAALGIAGEAGEFWIILRNLLSHRNY